MTDAPSLLASRALTAEERAAHDAEPRPGVGRDGVGLSQDETDLRIRRELFALARTDERDELVAIMGRDSVAGFARGAEQRGGLDSDPMVRLLAYRAWGDRDRTWTGARGIKAGEEVTLTFETQPSERVGLAWPNERVLGVARTGGFPGQEIEVRIFDREGRRYNDWSVNVLAARGEVDHGDRVGILRVSERPRVATPPRCADVIAYALYPDEPVAPVWTSAASVGALYDQCALLAIQARARAVASPSEAMSAMDDALRTIERLGGRDRWRTVRLLARVLSVSEQAVWSAFLAFEQRDGLQRRIIVAANTPRPPSRESYLPVLVAFGVPVPEARPAPTPAPRRERTPTLPMQTVAPRVDVVIDAMIAEATAGEATADEVTRREATGREATADAASPVAAPEMAAPEMAAPEMAAPEMVASLSHRSLGQRLRAWLRRA